MPCSSTVVLSDGRFGSVFAVEEDNENGIDPACLFIVNESETSSGLDTSTLPKEFEKEAVFNSGACMCMLVNNAKVSIVWYIVHVELLHEY